MSDLKRYYLQDFTQGNYRDLLKFARKSYEFRTYSNFKKSRKNCIILRHDIDASVPAALEIAEIESELGIRANYFILLHSPWYNLLEKEQTECVKKIISLGHSIGLHFDSEYYDISSEKDLVANLKHEQKFLQDLFKIKIEAFAFHNPDQTALKFDKWKYAGMINSYAGYFRKNAGYVSDSNGYWRHNRLIDELKLQRHKVLQVLTHPLHWQKKADYPKHKVWKHISENADRILKGYDKLLKDHKRGNLGEISNLLAGIGSGSKDHIFKIEKFWIRKDYNNAFGEIWILHKKMLNGLCKRKKVTLVQILKSAGITPKQYVKICELERKVTSGEADVAHSDALNAIDKIVKIIRTIRNYR